MTSLYYQTKIYKFKAINIKICENGLFSYKKIIPSLKENDRFIATFDDDIIYPNNSLEALIEQYKRISKLYCCK